MICGVAVSEADLVFMPAEGLDDPVFAVAAAGAQHKDHDERQRKTDYSFFHSGIPPFDEMIPNKYE